MPHATIVTPDQFATFGELLKYLRRRAGLTQRELSIAVGYSDTQISRLEQNQRVPDTATLTALFVPALHIEQEPEWAARLLELAAEARRAEALPATAVPAPPLPPHNLPLQLTSFIGREHDMAEVKRLLSTTRLLTLTGSGGCGKSRLSLQVAADLLAVFPDGIWLIELAPLADPTFVPQIAATTLGLRVEGNRPVLEALAENLRLKTILFILDNCEHLIDSCARLAEALMSTCPNLCILASSREALGVPGETAFRVPSLSLPETSAPFETLVGCEAVRLFVERARAALPDFEVTHHNASAITEVCRRLDGIPLAIELAAARVGVLRVEQIAARLSDRFRLLTGGSRTALPRHQTLRATMDWSYDLLQEDERILLRRTSVFAGGWTLEAAETICGWKGLAENAVLDVLTRLVNKSLVVAERHSGAEARYHMLETIRQYGNEKLDEAGESDALRDRHLKYFLNAAETGEPKLYGAEQIVYLNWLEGELDNFRAALVWSLQGNVMAGQQLAGALWWSWYLIGHLGEGYEWLERMLAVNPRDETLIRAKLLSGQGWMAGMLGYYEESKKLLEESIALFRKLGDEIGTALPLSNLGGHFYLQFDYELNTQLVTESLNIFKRAGNQWGVSRALSALGFNASVHGDFEQAQKFLEESLSIGKEIGDYEGVAFTLWLIAGLPVIQGNMARAMELYEQALEFAQVVKSKPMTAHILTEMGQAASYHGDYQRGRKCLEEALEIHRKMGDRGNVARALRYLGWNARLQGDYFNARSLYSESIQLTHRIQGNQLGLATCLIHVGNLALVQGSPEKFVLMLGAAERAAPGSRHMLLPSFGMETERFIENARAVLGDETYAAAWEAGQKMSLAEALDLALKTLEELTEIKLPAPIESASPTPLPSQREKEKQKYGGLTEREREVAAQIAQGKSNQAIAAELFVGLKTAEAHVTRILSKLGFTSRAQIAGWAVAKGLAQAPQDLDSLGREV